MSQSIFDALQCALVVGVIGLTVATSTVNAEIVEDFSHPVQSDSTGYNDGTDVFYRITTTGAYGNPADLFVATWSEGTSAVAGINFDGVDQFATFSTDAQSGFGSNQNILLGIADIPGFGDTSPGGNFGSFFSTPQDLTLAQGSVEIRQFTSQANGAVARFLAIDESDNEVVTNSFALNSGVFTQFNFSASDFVGGDPLFDETAVTGIGIEFFAFTDSGGSIGTFQFDIDNLRLSTIPEPQTAGVIAIVLGANFFARRRRRR